jgi:hypothetical protein
MHRILAMLLVIVVGLLAQGQTSTPRPPNTPPSPADSTSQQSQPPSPPSPPDAPIPDQGALPAPADQKQSPVKRKLEELAPNCLNVSWGFHTCWSSPPAAKPKTPIDPKAEAEFAEDMDVGDFYLNKKKNYAGAMMRFRDALDHKPNDPLATFRLAQSLEGLHQADEARQDYQTYLKLEPKGQFAGQATKALERLQSKSAAR